MFVVYLQMSSSTRVYIDNLSDQVRKSDVERLFKDFRFKYCVVKRKRWHGFVVSRIGTLKCNLNY